jgi:hypothetical protein
VMVNAVGPSVTTLYVDDVTICFSSQSMVTIEHCLQLGINCICHTEPCRMNFPFLQQRLSAYSHNCRVCNPPPPPPPICTLTTELYHLLQLSSS